MMYKNLASLVLLLAGARASYHLDTYGLDVSPVNYVDVDGFELQGFVSYPQAGGVVPAVVIIPDWVSSY
jgi:hypothetical protein